MREIKKEDWLNEMPELIYKLKFNYNFYFSCFYSNITKDILEITRNSKHKHKIVLYNRNNRFFLVIYRKNDFDIYYTNEYKEDTKNNRISYFVRKFKRAYKKAEEDYEKELYKDSSNSGLQ